MDVKNKTERRDVNLLFIGIGLALIIVISILDGFAASFASTIRHIISDFTIELKVHAYIAGLMLLAYGI